VRRRSAGVLAALLAAAALMPGCGSGGASGPETLSVYVSVPLHGPRAADGTAIAAGAKRALRRAGGRVRGIRIRAVYLDDTGGGPGWSMVATAANARRAAEDSAAIGFIGDVDSGATRVSLPITNQAEIAQISPASTAIDLTLDSSNGLGPERYQPSGEATFARIVPNDEVQAAAGAELLRRRTARAAVAEDGSDYGRVIGGAFESAARRLGLPLDGRFADYLAAERATAVLPAVRKAVAAHSNTFLAPDALIPDAGRICRAGGTGLLLTSPFAAPPRVYGSEAMSLLLDAVRRAGPDPSRGSVLDEVLATANRRSPLGRYSIDSNGDTTLRRIGVLRLRGCRPVRFRSVLAP